MKTLTAFSILVVALVLIQACGEVAAIPAPACTLAEFNSRAGLAYTNGQYNNTKGYWENGEIIREWYCPDAKAEFPALDVREWFKAAAVNGRLPSYEETMNGASIHHYGEKENPMVKPYKMILPRLAYYKGPSSITPSTPRWGELVIVIQIVQTPQDTIVGYRFLSGGVGGSLFRNFYFLNEKDMKTARIPQGGC